MSKDREDDAVRGRARTRIRGWRAGSRALAAGLALATLAACARTSVQDVNVEARGLPRPALIVVHDFVVSPDAVVPDRAIGSRILDVLKDTPESEQRLQIARDVARVVTNDLVEEINGLGLPAVSAANATPVAGSTLAIEGQYLSVDEGNRLRRMVIGFGAGASEVRTLVQVFEVTNDGQRLVEDFYTTVKSSLKPGVGPMAGAGAAAGSVAATTALSGGIGVATAFSQTVEADARHAAQEIAKTLRKFFVVQGWIAP
ncbi:MAG TPA: DUF4410 domain-containing protein [Candidatus Methylomirabilis sp.]|nr:DUF4410 domain-containing protein [Candidatus Methylomirabilis sp.]